MRKPELSRTTEADFTYSSSHSWYRSSSSSYFSLCFSAHLLCFFVFVSDRNVQLGDSLRDSPAEVKSNCRFPSLLSSTFNTCFFSAICYYYYSASLQILQLATNNHNLLCRAIIDAAPWEILGLAMYTKNIPKIECSFDNDMDRVSLKMASLK
jgi:hypothetical protein